MMALRGGSHTTVKIWDIVQRREKATIDDVVFFGPLRFSPDGRVLAVTSQHRKIPDRNPIVMLWDVGRGQETAVFSAYSGPEGDLFVRSLAFTDGQTLASGTDFKSRVGSGTDAPAEVTLWDLAAGRKRCTIQTKQYGSSSRPYNSSRPARLWEYRMAVRSCSVRST